MTFAHNRALVNTGVLVGAGVFSQIINIYRRLTGLNFIDVPYLRCRFGDAAVTKGYFISNTTMYCISPFVDVRRPNGRSPCPAPPSCASRTCS